jgi:ankyrin repeat protein
MTSDTNKAVSVVTFDEASKLIKKGDIIRLRQALEDGLSPDLCNKYSWTLLMIAALEGNTSIGTLLIDRGAILDSRNKFRETALSLAAHSGHPLFVQLLLSSGASLECYPFENTFDDWLNWVAKYSGSPEQAENIRRLFDIERKLRSESIPLP